MKFDSAATQHFVYLFFYLASITYLLVLRIKRQIDTRSVVSYALILFLLMCALLKPFIDHKVPVLNVVSLVDISESVDDQTGSAIYDSLASYKAAGVDISIVPFAGESLESGVNTSNYTDLRRTFEKLNIGETNLESALQKVEGGRILLLSDGFETKGNVQKIIPDMIGKGVKVYPLIPENFTQGTKGFLISQLSSPLIAPLQKSVDIRVTVQNSSDSAKSGLLEVFHDNKSVYKKHITVPPDKEEVIIAESNSNTEGIKEITAKLSPDDKNTPVSTQTSFLSGESREKVLLLNGAPDDALLLPQVLKNQAYQLTESNGEEASALLEKDEYSVIVINNVARQSFQGGVLEKIANKVRSGVGLVVIGGNRSFGLGGYINSPLEALLPVKLVPPQSEKKRLNIAVQLVIDKSQSMGADYKLESAKDASAQVIKNLKDEDFVGVTAFDSNPFPVVPLGQLAKIRQSALDRVEIIFPTRQTNLLPAMALARESLENSTAGRKHIIILTDGDIPDSGPHYVEFVKQMRFSGITISTVLIGPEFDRLMRQMADAGGGAFYNTANPSDLPRIFLQDIHVRSGEKTMKEQSEYAVRIGTGVLTSTTQKQFPFLSGYVETSPKEGANHELVVMTEDGTAPLLSSWKQEKGKVIAYTSDANGRWSSAWAKWPNFSRFWSNLVEAARDESVKAESVKHDTRFYLEGRNLILDLTVLSGGDFRDISGELKLPDGSRESLSFREIAKKRFRAELRSPKPGRYDFSGKFGGKDLIPVAYYLSGTLFGERKGQGFNIPLLQYIASQTGGVFNPAPKALLSDSSKKTEKIPLINYFLIGAIVFILYEIACREGVIGNLERGLRRLSRKGIN